MQPVALGGFMGSGKSTIAAHIAARTGSPVLDTDAVLVERHGPVALQFSRDGEPAFRARERALVEGLRPADAVIVATGGGVFADAACRAALRRAGYRLVTLRASLPLILARIGGDAARPLAGSGVAERLASREAGYADVDRVVDVDGRTPAAIAEEILAWLSSG